jgi:hypothetical protein
MERNLDIIDQNNKKSKYLIKGLTSSWGYLRNLFLKTPSQNVNTEVPADVVKPKMKENDDWQVVDPKESPDYVKEATPSLTK